MILLDTNALIRLLTEDPPVGPSARRAIEHSNRIHYSAISITEVVVKQMIGRLPPQVDLRGEVERAGLTELPFRARHAEEVERFPALVRHDPFDRMLLAQASVEGMQFLTSDALLLGLGLEWVLDARL